MTPGKRPASAETETRLCDLLDARKHVALAVLSLRGSSHKGAPSLSAKDLREAMGANLAAGGPMVDLLWRHGVVDVRLVAGVAGNEQYEVRLTEDGERFAQSFEALARALPKPRTGTIPRPRHHARRRR